MEKISQREAVVWVIEGVRQNEKTFHTVLHNTNGVHNPGARGSLICQAAELAGMIAAYKDTLQHLLQAGMVPADLLDDAWEAAKRK